MNCSWLIANPLLNNIYTPTVPETKKPDKFKKTGNENTH